MVNNILSAVSDRFPSEPPAYGRTLIVIFANYAILILGSRCGLCSSNEFDAGCDGFNCVFSPFNYNAARRIRTKHGSDLNMYDHEVFPNAPITEALIDLQVSMDDEFTLDRLKPVAELLQETFPQREEKTVHHQSIKLQANVGVSELSTRTEPVGSILFSEDRDEAVQIRVNGFTYSKLKPYENWPSLRDRARNLWGQYVETVKPVKVVRIATRYINRIELPKEELDFDDYITTGVRIGEGIPQGMTEFFFRAVIPSADHSMHAVVSSTFEPTGDDIDTVPYILDIDVFRPVVADPSSDEVWKILEHIREYKNAIFFQSTTDKAKALFR